MVGPSQPLSRVQPLANPTMTLLLFRLDAIQLHGPCTRQQPADAVRPCTHVSPTKLTFFGVARLSWLFHRLTELSRTATNVSTLTRPGEAALLGGCDPPPPPDAAASRPCSAASGISAAACGCAATGTGNKGTETGVQELHNSPFQGHRRACMPLLLLQQSPHLCRKPCAPKQLQPRQCSGVVLRSLLLLLHCEQHGVVLGPQGQVHAGRACCCCRCGSRRCRRTVEVVWLVLAVLAPARRRQQQCQHMTAPCRQASRGCPPAGAELAASRVGLGTCAVAGPFCCMGRTEPVHNCSWPSPAVAPGPLTRSDHNMHMAGSHLQRAFAPCSCVVPHSLAHLGAAHLRVVAVAILLHAAGPLALAAPQVCWAHDLYEHGCVRTRQYL